MAMFTILIITFVVFFIIQLPPGDFVDSLVTNMVAQGEVVNQADIDNLRVIYGLNKPFMVQYFDWLSNLVRGDWGTSFYFNKGVLSIIGETLGNTLMLSLITMIFTYVVSIPIAIYSAKNQYSILDYLFTIVGFIGMAIPNFLFAIILMYISFRWFGKPLMGLFPDGGITSFSSFLDFLSRLIIPTIVIGMGGTCGLIRSVRAQMLDEQQQPYVFMHKGKRRKRQGNHI